MGRPLSNIRISATSGTAIRSTTTRPRFQLSYGTGDPFVKASNKEIGTYIQDDWSPVKQLTLNLGVRWDYETNMLNTNHVTIRSGGGYADALRCQPGPSARSQPLHRHRQQSYAVQGRVSAASGLLLRGGPSGQNHDLRRLGSVLRSNPVRRSGRRKAEDHAPDIPDSVRTEGPGTDRERSSVE